MSNIGTRNRQVTRLSHLADKIVFIDGLTGCGKTLFSSIVSALDRVQLISYCFEIEHICALYYLDKIKKDAAEGMIKGLTDLQLYNIMQSRNVSFRPSDISSVWRDSNTLRYLIRLFQKGDEVVPERIAKDKPILSITTHQLMGFSEPIFHSLTDRVCMINIVRHPLFMIIQNHLNQERLMFNDNPRLFTLTHSYNGYQVCYYTKGWEELYLRSNKIDRAIHYIDKLTSIRESFYKKYNNVFENLILTIPFEKFVQDPWPYMKKIEKLLGTTITQKTIKVMRRQNVPRQKISDGIPLAIYKRCGWEPPEKGLTEKQELEKRRKYVLDQGASKEAMEVLDRTCQEYEEKYLR